MGYDRLNKSFFCFPRLARRLWMEPFKQPGHSSSRAGARVEFDLLGLVALVSAFVKIVRDRREIRYRRQTLSLSAPHGPLFRPHPVGQGQAVLEPSGRAGFEAGGGESGVGIAAK